MERWRCPEMHDMNSGGKAHFLIDNLKTALLLKAAANDKPRHDFYAFPHPRCGHRIPTTSGT